MHIRSVIILSSTIGAFSLGAVTPSFAGTFVQAGAAQTAAPQTAGAAKPAPKVPDAEMAAAKAIGASADAQAMVTAAAAFMQKFPKSTLTHQIAVNVSAKVGDVTDPAQLLTLATSFRAAFPGPGEADLVLPLIVEAELKLNKIDDAVKEVTDFLGRHPNDLVSLTQMTIVGAEQAKRRNPKYIEESQKDGAKAIAIIEADQRPEGMDDATWATYKTKWLALLYQSVGICSMVTGKADDAHARMSKSAAINPKDPTTFLLLGTMANDEYQKLAATYKATAAGPAQDEALKATLAALDTVIDDYAHVVGLSEGDASFKQVHDSILEDLTAFYKYRHKNTDGLQTLIDKYKPTGGGL